MRRTLGRIAYATVFVVILPLGLVLWARRLDDVIDLPRLQSTMIGAALLTSGIALTVVAMATLWMRGGGLPASPYPPVRFVTTGPYRVLAHPIYVGTIIAALGAAVLAGSPAGLWVVTPVLAGAAAAWVLGFEGDLTKRHFGDHAAPLLHVAVESDAAPALSERLSAYVLVLLPWLVLYMAIEALGAPPDARSAYMSWERTLPVLAWTEAIYALAYPIVLLAPFVAHRRRDLRRFLLDGLWAMVVVMPVYLLVPLIVEPRPISSSGFWPSLLRLERAADNPVTAFPAYHVVWPLIALRAYVARWPRMKHAATVLALAIAVSCITTGMHAVADVVGGATAFVIVVYRVRVWSAMRSAAETIANAWGEWSAGPVRFLSHGVYAAIGGGLGVAIAVTLSGIRLLPWLLALAAAAIVGAAVWAQLVEGSSQLLRPYGYFGSVVGVVVVLIAAGTLGADVWLIATSFSIGATVTHALGRLRCLVQGCCHGAETSRAAGIVYTSPRSRVVRLGNLAGKAIHPTQLYSIVWMLLVGAALLRLWSVGAPLPFITGAYFVLTGLGRFVEEHHRGEPQTLSVGGLRLYQWLSIVFVVGGAALTTVRGAPAPSISGFDGAAVAPLVLLSALIYVAYGVDFPRSNRRLSRLV